MAEQIKTLGKVCLTPEGEWDINKKYDRLALVIGHDSQTNELMSFISRKQVPPGRIELDNKDYWQKFTSKVHFEDIELREDGWIYIGDTPVYQVTLQDAIGQAVVDKIEQGLTEKIMSAIVLYMTDTTNEIKRYMGGVVSDFISAITEQVSRLIIDGIKVNNNIVAEVNNKVSGKLNTEVEGVVHENVNGILDTNVKGSIENKQSGEVLNKLTGSVNAGVVVQGNIDNNLDGKVKVEHEGTVNNVNSGSINSSVALSGGIKVDDGQPEPPETFTVNVVTNPVTAKVTLDGVETKSKAFVKGSTILVVVSQEGYVTETRTISNLTEDTTINVTLTEKAPVYFFAAQPLNNYISENGGTIDCLVISLKNSVLQDYTYSVEGDIIDSVNKLESNLIIAVKPNSDDSSKTARINLTQVESGKVLTIVINQKGQSTSDVYVFESNKTSINSDYTAKTEQVNITSTKNGNYLDYTIRATPSWSNVSKDSNNNLVVVLTENSANTDRNGVIELVQNETSAVKLITVNQTGKPSDVFVFEVQTNPLSINGQGGSIGTQITSTKNGTNVDFNIGTVPSWLNLTKGSSNISGTVAINYSDSVRTATIQLTQVESGKVINLIINQQGSDIQFYANPISHSCNANANTLNSLITSKLNNANLDYDITTNVGWISCIKGTDALSINVDANTSTESRTGVLSLVQQNTGKTAQITVVQERKQEDVYEFDVDKNSISFAQIGGSSTVLVTSSKNGNYFDGLSIVSKPDWTTVTPGSVVETVKKSYDISVGANDSLSSRSGIVVIKQTKSDGTKVTKNISVSQSGKTLIITKSISDAYGKRSGELTPLEILNADSNNYQPYITVNAKLDGSDVDVIFVQDKILFNSNKSTGQESWATPSVHGTDDVIRITRTGSTPQQNFTLVYDVEFTIREKGSGSIIDTRTFELQWRWNSNV